MAKTRQGILLVLDIRRAKEREAALVLATAEAAHQAASGERDALLGRLNNGREYVINEGRAGDMLGLRGSITRLYEALNRQEEVVERAAVDMARATRGVEIAYQERRLMEKVAQKREAEKVLQEQMAERVLLDELALTRHARLHAESLRQAGERV